MTRGRWAIVAVAVVVVAGAVMVWRGRGRSEDPKFRTAAIDRGAIEAVVSATGTVQPVVQVEVGSQVSGTVYRIHADFNSRVRQGQVLCEIEPSSLRAREVQNQAAVVKAEVSVKDAQRVLGRARELVKQNYVSQAEVEAAEVALEQRQADLRQARAALQVAEVDVRNAVIRAPIDGVVIARSIDLGQTVAASLQAPKLFVIANDLAQMQVETRIDEADIGRILPGLPVRFTVDAYPDMEFHGEVAQVRLEPIADQGVVTYTTVIKTGNPGLRLKPGMTANVSVQVAERQDVLKVPAAALRFRPPMGDGRGAAMAAPAPGGPGRTMAGAAPGASRGGAGVPAGRERTGDGAGSWRGRQNGAGQNRMMGGAARGGPAHPTPENGAGGRGMAAAEETPASEGPRAKPGAVYVLRGGQPERVEVMTGISDGTFTEVQSDQLKPGDTVIVGTENVARGPAMQPPPGMGGPFMMGGPRGGGRSGGGRSGGGR